MITDYKMTYSIDNKQVTEIDQASVDMVKKLIDKKLDEYYTPVENAEKTLSFQGLKSGYNLVDNEIKIGDMMLMQYKVKNKVFKRFDEKGFYGKIVDLNFMSSPYSISIVSETVNKRQTFSIVFSDDGKYDCKLNGLNVKFYNIKFVVIKKSAIGYLDT
jgi:hypothetical protein